MKKPTQDYRSGEESQRGYSNMKRRGNPNWGKPESGPVIPVVTEFEKTVIEYTYARSVFAIMRATEWGQRNKNSKFIPEPLLKASAFEIEASDY